MLETESYLQFVELKKEVIELKSEVVQLRKRIYEIVALSSLPEEYKSTYLNK